MFVTIHVAARNSLLFFPQGVGTHRRAFLTATRYNVIGFGWFSPGRLRCTPTVFLG